MLFVLYVHKCNQIIGVNIASHAIFLGVQGSYQHLSLKYQLSFVHVSIILPPNSSLPLVSTPKIHLKVTTTLHCLLCGKAMSLEKYIHVSVDGF